MSAPTVFADHPKWSRGEEMVRPRRFELLTYRFGGCRSIQLSYGRAHLKRSIVRMKTTFLPTALLAFACCGTALSQAPMAPMTDHGTAAPGKALASPAATATAMIGGKSVIIKYNSPSLRGRKMIGDHEPYGKVWRTGANPATTLITATDLTIGDLNVPAGTYTIFSIPAAPGTPWQLIINKQTGQWGTEYKQEMDLGRTPMMTKAVTSPQEVMKISFEKVHGKSAELHIRWADADEYVKVEAK